MLILIDKKILTILRSYILIYDFCFSDFPMLETVIQPRQRMEAAMPVDFTTYLLSSSPPATNIEFISYAFSHEAARNFQLEHNGFTRPSPAEIRRKRNNIKPIILRNTDILNNNCFSDGENSTPSSGTVTPTSPSSPGRLRKKVSFADHKGLALATVRIMSEPSDQPPRLGPNIIDSIAKGVNTDDSDEPPFELKFGQPASDYLAFRDKIEKNCVSLENVILRDYNVLGTIKVKNICFDKKVFARCTFDSWSTSLDIEAKYVQPPGDSSGHSVDTFSFELDIPVDFDSTKKIQFCVCFQTPTGEHWDSNNGENYEISPRKYIPKPIQNLFPSSNTQTLHRVSSWTEYACWNHVDTSTPYY